MGEALLVDNGQRAQHLLDDGQGLGFTQAASSAQAVGQRLPVDVIHHVVGGAVVFKQIVYLGDALTVEPVDSLRLFLELLPLALKHLGIVLLAHADRSANAIVDATHEEFLHGEGGVKIEVLHHISVAEAAT